MGLGYASRLSARLLLCGCIVWLSSPPRTATAWQTPPVPLSQALPSASSPDAFAGDPRLVQKVTLHVEGLPVGELLALLSKKTGVALTVQTSLADDKVIAFTPSRPLRASLSDLAALFNDAWLRIEEKGEPIRYELVRSRKAQEYEDGLAARPADALLAKLDELVRALAETPEQLAQRPKNDPVRRTLSQPKTRLAVQFFAMLSQAERDQLVHDGHTDAIPYAVLSPDQQAVLRSMFQAEIEDQKQHPKVQTYMYSEGYRDVPAKFEHKVILPDIQEMEGGSIRFNYFAAGGVTLQLGRYVKLLVGYYPETARFLLPIHGDPYTGKPVGATASPDDPTVQEAARQGDWVDRLAVLTRTTGRSLFADYYRFGTNDPLSTVRTFPDNTKETLPLDALCRSQRYLWWARGKTLLLRQREWYNTRRYEPPDRWVLSVGRQIKANRYVPTFGAVYRLLELTPEQFQGVNGGRSAAEAGGDPRAARIYLRLLQSGVHPEQNVPRNDAVDRAPLLTYRALSGAGREVAGQLLARTYPPLTGSLETLLAALYYSYPKPEMTPEETQALTEASARVLQGRSEVEATDEDREEIMQQDLLIRNRYSRLRRGIPAPTRGKIVFFGGSCELSGGKNLYPDNPLGNSNQLSISLEIPIDLPDDRRDKTRVEVVP